jgi:hypothetical protein
MMRDRLEVIRNLLSDDGSLWVTLDDNEVHYFKVMADEILGRQNPGHARAGELSGRLDIAVRAI